MNIEQEKKLLKQAKAGKAEAYGQLIEHYQERLYRRAVSLLDRPELAEDALQSSLLSAYQALPKFRGDSSIYTWLYRIVTNQCRNCLQSQKRQSSQNISKLEPVLRDNRINLEKETELSEDFRYLMAKINSLPEKYRSLILYRYYDDLSYTEIASLIHAHVGTVKSRLFKARALLRKALSEDGRESDLLDT